MKTNDTKVRAHLIYTRNTVFNRRDRRYDYDFFFFVHGSLLCTFLRHNNFLCTYEPLLTLGLIAVLCIYSVVEFIVQIT